VCEVSTVMTALAIAGAGASTYSQIQAANTQAAALNAQRKAQAEELHAREQQQMGERVKQARKERARMLVAAGEAGVRGPSFEAQLMNSFSQQNQDLATIRKQGFFNNRASEASIGSAFASIRKPNVLSAGLQIADAGYTAYNNFNTSERLKRLSIPEG